MPALRSIILFLSVGALMMSSVTAPAAEQDKNAATKYRVYLGAYTGGGSEGIYLAEFDASTGKLGAPELAGKAVNPSYLTMHPTKPLLFAVSEISEMKGKKTGAVSSFKVDADGKLTMINQQASEGDGPCHLTVDRTGKVALVANYGGGSIASLPIDEDGKLGPAASAIQHEGMGGTARQTKPHAHSINVDAGNRFAIVADLGLDKVLVYRLDPAKAELKANDPPSVSMAPGAGPRHFAFHPNGKHAYVINELDCTMTVFNYSPEQGTLEKVQTVPTLPREVMKGDSTAEVVVHPSGKFLYGSNRGHNSIVAYSIDAESGKITLVGHVESGGKTPRNFNIDPTGAYLLAAHQDSDNVVVFRIDTATGKLTATGQEIKVSKPVCVKFVAAK